MEITVGQVTVVTKSKVLAIVGIQTYVVWPLHWANSAPNSSIYNN